MRALILILLMSLAAYSQTPPIEPGVSEELAQWRAARYSDVRYKLNLTLEKMSPVLKGTIEIRVNVRRGDGETRGRGDEDTRGHGVGDASGRGDTQAVPPALAGGTAPIVLDWRKIKGHEEKSTISHVSLNGRALSAVDESNEHLIFRNGVIVGENVIKLDFTSPILASGSAITRYIDKEDGSEYIYSLFVPSDASTAFPVFDQPDLKAKFSLKIDQPLDWKGDWRKQGDWKFVSNTEGSPYIENFNGPTGRYMYNGSEFAETKPISTYVFAFAAGPWQQVSVPSASAGGSPRSIEATRGNPSAHADGTDLSSHIFVRKSQLSKFQPHAAEVFRLNREGIKFLEEYFNYKYPFPKYDIVLIPEFPFGGMEHAGATFLREASVIFPSEPTANDHISRANLIFHEAAHQWFGDTVTMRWFDDLWLKEGFAEFMAYKTLERVMPQYNAWKAFYERNKPAAYFTDSTRGTTPIYQEIRNLSAAKSAYGNIVYRKAPSFLKQAEFYLGADKFQTAVRAFLKKNEFANGGWEHLVAEFEKVGGRPLTDPMGMSRDDMDKYAAHEKERIEFFNELWVKVRGLVIVRLENRELPKQWDHFSFGQVHSIQGSQGGQCYTMKFKYLVGFGNGRKREDETEFDCFRSATNENVLRTDDRTKNQSIDFIFPNYQDYGYGIFLLDDKSRDYILKNIQNEKDEFLRSMMWGSLWDSVREGELDPKEYVELAIKNLPTEKDETTIPAILGRASTAMTYYVSDKARDAIAPRLESILIEKMRTAPTLGQRITYYRALLNVASAENARNVLKALLQQQSVPSASAGGSESAKKNPSTHADGTDTRRRVGDAAAGGGNPTGREGVNAGIPLKTKDRFDIVTRLASLNDPDAELLLKELERTETSDDAKRYAYAARGAFPTKATKEKYWNDFVNNKEISESWIEAAFGPFNSVRHADLTLPYLERALNELPNHKRNRKIFFVNGWLAAFIGGQKSPEALAIVNKFLADNPNLDRDLRLKILENVDVIERAVKIRSKYAN